MLSVCPFCGPQNKIIPLKLLLRSFRNPDFLERLADGTHIVDYGTNFSPEVFNPTPQNPEDFFDAIRESSSLPSTNQTQPLRHHCLA